MTSRAEPCLYVCLGVRRTDKHTAEIANIKGRDTNFSTKDWILYTVRNKIFKVNLKATYKRYNFLTLINKNIIYLSRNDEHNTKCSCEPTRDAGERNARATSVHNHFKACTSE